MINLEKFHYASGGMCGYLFENKIDVNNLMRTENIMTILKEECQIHTVGRIGLPLTRRGIIWQLRNRIKRIIKRRWKYVINLIEEIIFQRRNKELQSKMQKLSNERLIPGDMVRVRSKDEIESTLTNWNDLKGCAMMEEMWQYCNTKQRVFKRVGKFLDERDYLIKKCNGIILLEGIICNGTKDFGACDRSCFYFWREEWLEKVK